MDTDDLNADLALAALCLLKEHSPAFSELDLQAAGMEEGLCRRPPCRWEQHNRLVSTVDQASGQQRDVSVCAVLDMGHNPAAISALSKRIRRDFHDSKVRCVFLG